MSKPSKPLALPQFRSIRAVADRLGISPRSVQRLIENGSLPAHKFAGAVRVSDEDLQQFVARSRQANTQEM